MAKMIQVRNVPDKLHRELARRAKKRGQTLTEFVEQLLERHVATPLPEEVFARIASRAPIRLRRPAAELVREGREEQDRKWERARKRKP